MRDAVDIGAWLRQLGLERYEQAFRDNDIASAALPELTDQDLKDLDVFLGHRRLLLKAIRAVADDQAGHSSCRKRTRSGGRAPPADVLFCDLWARPSCRRGSIRRTCARSCGPIRQLAPT